MFGNKKKQNKAKENLRMYELQSKKKRELTSGEKKELKKLERKKSNEDFDKMAFWMEVFDDD